jgi:hypothetical protein
LLWEKNMTKLHELLAVQSSLSGQASKVRQELAVTFEKKRHLFEERRKSFRSNEEGVPVAVEEQQDIQTTVASEIEWISNHLAKAVDVAYQVDLANTEAKADVVTEDGETLVKDLPATTLLQLEKRVAEWKELIVAIPTLDPAKGFKPDEMRGLGFWKARDVTKPRTKKEKKPLVLYPATDKHPAQTQVLDVDTVTGTILEQEWSALITPTMKAELLDRVETLYRAVTKARSKANDHSVDTAGKKIGETLLDFVFKPLTAS